MSELQEVEDQKLLKKKCAICKVKVIHRLYELPPGDPLQIRYIPAEYPDTHNAPCGLRCSASFGMNLAKWPILHCRKSCARCGQKPKKHGRPTKYERLQALPRPKPTKIQAAFAARRRIMKKWGLT